MKEKIDVALQWLQDAESSAYIGENVSQLTHALQCAYFAKTSGHSEEVILASLFHDIGHFVETGQQLMMDHLGVVYHEWLGARLALEIGFSAKAALLIACHVDAKRYLVTKKTSYGARLSDASKQTLAFQGGVMSAQEMQAFENHPYFNEILQVRINDEKGKVPGLAVPVLQDYRPLLVNHVNKNRENKLSCTDFALTDYIDRDWVEGFKFYLFRKSGVFVDML